MRPQDFWRIYHTIYPRRWLLAALLGGTLTLVAIVCLCTPRYYRASALVMPSQSALTKPVIPGTGAALVSASARPAESPRLEEQLATLIGLAETGEVRDRAIRSLHLRLSPSELEQLVTAEPGKGNIIRISALGRTPGEAVSLANAIAHEFTAYYQRIASHQAMQNRTFLASALADAQTKTEVVKVELQSLKSREGEASLPVGTAENPFLTQFYGLRRDVDTTNSLLNEVEGRLAGIRSELKRQSPTKQSVTSTTENPEADQLREDLTQADRDLLIAQTHYTDKHRKVIDLKARVADLTARLAREEGHPVVKRTVAENPTYERLRDEITNLRADREAYGAKLVALRKAMQENERRASELADSSVVLAAKSGEYDTAKARGDELKQMLDAATLEERIISTSGEIQVVDPATSASGPVTKGGPSLVNLILLGLFLSLALSFGTVAALAFLDSRVQGRQDLQQGLGLPVPTVVPVVMAGTAARPLARVTDQDPESAHAEAYRYLRAQLLYQKGGKPIRTILIATAKPAQGGTTTATNLALSLAEVGQRVVLVDADLRRPSLHRFFGLKNEVGLTDLLRGEASCEQALRPTDMPDLRLVTAGTKAANPAALLSSGAMTKLLSELRANADYVVLDAPSLGAFADVMMLGPLVDGVLLVARANQSLSHVEQQAKEMLERVGANIIGAVLNAASPDKVTNWYYHQHYYGAPSSSAGSPPDGPEGGASDGAAPVTVMHTPVRGTAPLRRRRVANLLLGAVGFLAVAALLLVVTHPRHVPVSAPRAHPAVAKHALTLTAEVKEPTEVRVTRDGEVLYDGVLTIGTQIWQADRELIVWADRPEALVLTLNGRPVGPLGEAGSAPVSRRFSVGETSAL